MAVSVLLGVADCVGAFGGLRLAFPHADDPTLFLAWFGVSLVLVVLTSLLVHVVGEALSRREGGEPS